MKKNILISICILILVISLVGCGDNKTLDKPSSQTSIESQSKEESSSQVSSEQISEELSSVQTNPKPESQDVSSNQTSHEQESKEELSSQNSHEQESKEESSSQNNSISAEVQNSSNNQIPSQQNSFNAEDYDTIRYVFPLYNNEGKTTTTIQEMVNASSKNANEIGDTRAVDIDTITIEVTGSDMVVQISDIATIDKIYEMFGESLISFDTGQTNPSTGGSLVISIYFKDKTYSTITFAGIVFFNGDYTHYHIFADKSNENSYWDLYDNLVGN